MRHQHAALGKAGFEVALVFPDLLVELLQRPGAAWIGGRELHGVEPLRQGFEAKRNRNLRQPGRQRCHRVAELASADQQLDIVVADVVVARVCCQRVAQARQRGLHIARFQVLLGLLGVGLRGQFVLAGQVLVEELAQFSLGQRTHEAVHRLAPLHQDAGRDALDAEGAGQLLLVVGIDLDQLEAAFISDLQLFQDRAERLAGAAPGRPEIDQNRGGHRGGNHLGFEVLQGDVNHGGVNPGETLKFNIPSKSPQ